MFIIKNNVSNELIIKNSRFITTLYKISDLEEIKVYLSKIKEAYPDATHYCYAYILDDNKKSYDDNEPTGTAGTPIMQVLNHNNINNVLAIVIRYFGGIKLGSNGLIRAYSKSISSCLSKTILIELELGKNIDLIFNYSKINNIDYLLKDYDIIKKDFQENIIYNVNVDLAKLDELKTINNINIIINKDITIEKK